MATKVEKQGARKVLVTTKHRGVFYGEEVDRVGDKITLGSARCAIKWGTSRGFVELASDGPNGKSLIGAVAPKIELYDVTSVTEVSEKAAQAWEKA